MGGPRLGVRATCESLPVPCRVFGLLAMLESGPVSWEIGFLINCSALRQAKLNARFMVELKELERKTKWARIPQCAALRREGANWNSPPMKTLK